MVAASASEFFHRVGCLFGNRTEEAVAECARVSAHLRSHLDGLSVEGRPVVGHLCVFREAEAAGRDGNRGELWIEPPRGVLRVGEVDVFLRDVNRVG